MYDSRTLMLALLVSTTALGDDITVNSFTSGTTISSSDMNTNFDVVVAESNENDARIGVLEASNSLPQLVWVDATNKTVGYPVGIENNVYPHLVVKYPDSDRAFYLIQNLRNPVNQSWYNTTTYFTEQGCVGDAYFQQYGSSGYSSFAFHGSVLEVGSTSDGYAVFPNFDAAEITGPPANTFAYSRLTVQADGSLECINQEFDYGTGVWTAGIVSSSQRDLDIQLPVRLVWR